MNRIYKSSVVKLYLVMIALLVLTTNISSASHDPWGENLQPKLHTDYLNEYSGKKILSINGVVDACHFNGIRIQSSLQKKVFFISLDSKRQKYAYYCLQTFRPSSTSEVNKNSPGTFAIERLIQLLIVL